MMTAIPKKIFLLFISACIGLAAMGQPLIVNKVSEDDENLSLREIIYKHMYDTISETTFDPFEMQDIKGNLISRNYNNNKPAFIYYFSTACKACHSDLIEILPALLKEFDNEIDFIIFTPASKDEILKENLPLLDKFSIIIYPINFFRTGFPMAYLLNRNNDVVLKRKGGGLGTKRKETLEIHQQILKEWFSRIVNDCNN